jgi:predicted lipoprotein with Yx(FWY)xxD motif
MQDNRPPKLLIAAFAAMAIVAACSNSGGGSATSAPSSAAASASASEAAPSASASASASEGASASTAAGGAVELKVATSDLGEILTDGTGKTLYMFTPDEGGTPKCYEQCAENWPPLVASDAASVSAGTGLDSSKIELVDRTDGTKQVKYGEYPLYYFAADAAAGDTNGQGLNSKWYVVGTDGEPIKG